MKRPCLLTLLAVLALHACASGPQSTDDAITAVMTAAKLTTSATCGPALDVWLGPLAPARTTLPAERTAATVAAYLRAWLCSPVVGAAVEAFDAIRRTVATASRPAPVAPSPEPLPEVDGGVLPVTLLDAGAGE